MEDFQAFAFRAALTNVLENMPASALAERAAQAAEGCAFIQHASAPRGAWTHWYCCTLMRRPSPSRRFSTPDLLSIMSAIPFNQASYYRLHVVRPRLVDAMSCTCFAASGALLCHGFVRCGHVNAICEIQCRSPDSGPNIYPAAACAQAVLGGRAGPCRA